MYGVQPGSRRGLMTLVADDLYLRMHAAENSVPPPRGVARCRRTERTPSRGAACSLRGRRAR